MNDAFDDLYARLWPASERHSAHKAKVREVYQAGVEHGERLVAERAAENAAERDWNDTEKTR